MNLWSVIEKSPQRIVTQEKLGESSHPIASILMFLLCCVPGFVALWMGIPNLPKTLSCKPSGSISQCQESQNFLNIPVKTRSFVQQQKISTPIERELGGNSTITSIGLSYIIGLAGIVILYSSMVVSRRVWVFDRNRQIIVNEKYTALRKTEQRYRKQDVFSIILEINDLCIKANSEHVVVRLNLQSAEQPTRYLPFNSKQPMIYICEYNRIAEVIDTVVRPTSQALQVPYQLKFFFQQQSCSIFDFDRQCIDVFSARNTCQIPFANIQGFRIEKTSDMQKIVVITDNSIDIDRSNSYTYQLLLVTKDGDCIPINQVESHDSSIRPEREEAMLSFDNNRGYEWMELLQQQLEKLLNLAIMV
jgi:hypothetical protein